MVPVTVALIVLLLFLNFRNLAEVLIILGTLPIALVGGVWLLYLLGYNLSVAVGGWGSERILDNGLEER